jgi:two-component system cell cycle response regulator
MMPGMDGYEVCKCLRADASTQDIPIIMVSAGKILVDDITAGSEAGADDYLTKPFLSTN